MTKSIPAAAREDLRYSVDGKALVDGISLTINPATFTVVLGPNGAGKSLLLRLLHGMLAPTSGTVACATGINGDLRRRRAMVFQRPVLLRRSVEANIAYALGALGIPRGQRPAMIELALSRAGLRDARRVGAPVIGRGTAAPVRRPRAGLRARYHVPG